MSETSLKAEHVVDLDHVAHEFETWRTTRQHKGRIPDRLWDEALSLVRSYPPSMVAQRLHLNYSELKRRMDHRDPLPSRMNNLSFIELGLGDQSPAHLRSSSRCLFDVETSSGTRYRCTVEGSIPDSLLRFFHSLR